MGRCNSAVHIRIRLRAGRAGNHNSISCRSERDLSLLQSVHTGSDTHTASHAKVLQDLFRQSSGRGVKLTTHSIQCRGYEWSCNSTPSYAFVLCRGTTLFLQSIFHHHHHHHKSVMELGHLLTRYGLTYPEVSSKV